MLVENVRGSTYRVTFIYASNFLLDREKLWIDIANEAKQVSIPWLLLGDFNNITSLNDKKGGTLVPFRYMSGLIDCNTTSGLMEINIAGFKNTWRKKGIATKIDKVFCYSEFLEVLPNSHVVGIANPVSDHIPLCILFKNG